MPVAIVIAGARRIGASIVRGLAASGYDVGITYNHSKMEALELCQEIQQSGRHSYAVQCDVTDDAQLTRVLRELALRMGHADMIVFNAGVFPDATHPADLSQDELLNAIRVNTIPVLTLAKWYDRNCLEYNLPGRLVVLGSLGAREIWRDRAAYNTSKAAQQTLVMSLARSLAPRLSINIVAPGVIVTDQERHESTAPIVSERRIPMERAGDAADIVDAVQYFASCSRYITGQVLVVDGGYGLVR
ncbi:MAG: SDR family oxidoreductase [Candidatus Kapabacteria bacterium]|nr:SDR family oxidoreductase [Candidatus Kapabacteria bacterium]